MWTIVLGFAFTAFLVFYAFQYIDLLQPYKTYQHPALLAWVFCMLVMIVVSLLTKPPPPEKIDGIIWSPHYAKLPLELRQKYRGWRDYRIWWAVFVLVHPGDLRVLPLVPVPAVRRGRRSAARPARTLARSRCCDENAGIDVIVRRQLCDARLADAAFAVKDQ